MTRAADQRKVIKYAFLKGKLVPKAQVVGEDSVAVASPSVAATDDLSQDLGLDAPKRRGRPPKIQQETDLETVETETETGPDESEFLIRD